MPGTAVAYAVDVTSPESSARGADRYLGELQRRFGNIGLALTAYNWGPTNLAQWLKKPSAKVSAIPLETREYVRAITGHGIEAFLGKNPPKLDKGHIGKLAQEMAGAR
jgi:soluble lytic murein transglycosylase-like protein